jgi:hypothetical protein
MLEGFGEAIDGRNNSIAIRHRQRAAGKEIVLNVD